MAEVILPSSLVQLFPGAVKQIQLEAKTVREVIDALDEKWPGMRNRLCTSGKELREHIRIFVDSEQATLDSPIGVSSEVMIIPALSGG